MKDDGRYRPVHVRKYGRHRPSGRLRDPFGHLVEKTKTGHQRDVEREQDEAVEKDENPAVHPLHGMLRQIDADQRHPSQQDLQTLPTGTRFQLLDDHHLRSVANE